MSNVKKEEIVPGSQLQGIHKIRNENAAVGVTLEMNVYCQE